MYLLIYCNKFISQEIRNTFQEFESTLAKCESSCKVALQTTANRGQQAMKQELDMLFLEWDDFKTKLITHKENLEQGLAHWDRYEEQFEKQQVWLKEMEKKSKDFKLVSTKAAKEEQFAIYKVCMSIQCAIFFIIVFCLEFVF